MEIKTYKTKDTKFPWVAEDTEGHIVNARTKEAAINTLKNLYHLIPKITEQQKVDIPKDVKLYE